MRTAGTYSEHYNLDDLQCEIGHLSHLIDVIAHTILEDCEFGPPEARLPGMDRLSALIMIARDLAERLDEQVTANYDSIRRGGVMITPIYNPPGADFRENPAVAVSGLSSLFTVCALALRGAEDWNEDIRKRVTDEIAHVLELGALMAIDITIDVERLSEGKTDNMMKGRVSK